MKLTISRHDAEWRYVERDGEKRHKNNDYRTTGEKRGESWWGECESVHINGDEFTVRITESGVSIWPTRNNTQEILPVFTLPLPLPKP